MGSSQPAIPPPERSTARIHSTHRIVAIDAMRGGALLMMIAYHFGFDLNHLGWIHYDINYDQRWLLARALILGSFLLLVGMSLALAEAQQKNPRQQWSRIGKIIAASGLVTAGSWLFIPDLTIYFGTLQAIALMSLALLLRPLPSWLAGIFGVIVIGLGNYCAHPAFDMPGLAWLGLMTHKPQTADYVPMLPWFGVCLIGYALAKVLLQDQRSRTLGNKLHWPPVLAWLGQHSLAVYLVHQPLLLGMMIPITHLLKSS